MSPTPIVLTELLRDLHRPQPARYGALPERRRQAMDARADGGWQPLSRKRTVSRALRAYAALARSAAFSAVRDPALVEGRGREG